MRKLFTKASGPLPSERACSFDLPNSPTRLLRSELELLNKSINLKEANLRLSQACKTAGVER